MRRLNLPVSEKVPIQLATFTTCLLDLVKVKIQFGNHRFMVKLLVHNKASMESNCPRIYEVSQQLEQEGYHLADHHISSDTLTGIEILIGVDYFSCFISRQRRAKGMSLFVTKDRGVIPFGPLPKWASQQQSHMQFRCARILCESEPDVSQLWKLESIGISREEFSPSQQETISQVHSNMQKSELGYIVHLPFKSDARQFTNYRTACGQLNSLAQHAAQDEKFYDDYNGVVDDYITKDFIKEIPSEPIVGHYMPHHPMYKKSATTPIRIVFNASSKPTGGKSLNDCLLTGPTLTEKLHDILLTFPKCKHAVTADISKAFHRVIVNERDWNYLRFLWISHDQSQLRTFCFKVEVFGATCSLYLMQEIIQTHLKENVLGNQFAEKFYVDKYLNRYYRECDLINDKAKLDDLMLDANMPLQEWVSNSNYFNLLYRLVIPITQNILGVSWEPRADTLHITPGDKLMNAASGKFTKQNVLSLISSLFDPHGWLSPLSIKGRIFLQTLWKNKVGWDQEILLQLFDLRAMEMCHTFNK